MTALAILVVLAMWFTLAWVLACPIGRWLAACSSAGQPLVVSEPCLSERERQYVRGVAEAVEILLRDADCWLCGLVGEEFCPEHAGSDAL